MVSVSANASINSRIVRGRAVINGGGRNTTAATVNNRTLSTTASVSDNQQINTNASVVHNQCNATVGMNVGVTDHDRLRNLDYEHAGHTGFQPTLTEENAGDGIDITDGVISCTVNGAEWGNIEGNILNQNDLVEFVKSEHRAYYNNYTMYEGVAPYGSLATDAVWTITTIVSNEVGSIVSVSTATNQVWNYN